MRAPGKVNLCLHVGAPRADGLHPLVSLVQRNRRRYGGYLVHVGVAVLFWSAAVDRRGTSDVA